MSDGPDFSNLGRLVDRPLTEAWAHEAYHFTVWLSENLDRLSDVLGITLEHVDREVPIGTFYADIIARNVDAEEGADVVLIENQLAPSDHRHLGQIMTYLAGADANTVVWIAESFRDEHLSAIEWLNHNTSTGFSFFAVKLRAVRIGESQLAPLLDVLAKPNDWERQIRDAASKTGLTKEGQLTGAFWKTYLNAHPDAISLGAKEWNSRNNYLTVTPEVSVSIWATTSNSGVFICPPRKKDLNTCLALLAPHLDNLQNRLGAQRRNGQGDHILLPLRQSVGINNSEDWPKVIAWLHTEADRYIAALREILDDSDPHESTTE